MKVEPAVLILGGGAAGILAANKIADSGRTVVLVESTDKLGGKVLNLNSFYQSEISPSQWLAEKVSTLEKSDKVQIKLNTAASKVKGVAGNFSVKLKGSSGNEELKFGAIVLTIGASYVKSIPLEVGSDISYLSFVELESDKKLLEGSKDKTFVLIAKEGDSIIGFANALKNARILANNGNNVYLVYDELKINEKKMEKLYHQCRAEGVRFIKGFNDINIKENGQLTYKDNLLPEKVAKEMTIKYDHLVVAEDVKPNSDVLEIKEIFKVDTGEDGFFQQDNYHLEPILTQKAGIYVSGDCKRASFIHIIEQEAAAIAIEAHNMLEQNMEDFASKPYIEPRLCAFCLTCYRSCPWKAIEFDYPEEAAFINPVACQKCGTCVTECPNRVIIHPSYTLEDMDDTLEKDGIKETNVVGKTHGLFDTGAIKASEAGGN